MTSLTLISYEAERLLKPIDQTRRRMLQKSLITLCEDHWRELRGPQPDLLIDRTLWSITPPWSDLLIDLYVTNDQRLNPLMPHANPAKGFALLVLAEIERGNEAGVHLTHEPMMAFEITPPPNEWLERISSLLRGTLIPPELHRHDRREHLWKALALITANTRRVDLPATLEVISLLTSTHAESDVGVGKLLREVLRLGIRFLGIVGDDIHFEQHGHTHNPMRVRQVAEMLLEIRRKWLH